MGMVSSIFKGGSKILGGAFHAFGNAADSLDKALGLGLQQAAVAETPAPPAVTPPPVMPLPDDEAIQQARKRSLAEQFKRRGRASTILTAGSGGDALGGG